MNNLIVKSFNGNEVHTFIWNEKPCWIANEIVSMFDYADASTTIGQCIETEEFEEGAEYETLLKDDLKKFKKMVNSLTKINLVSSNAPHLIIFYEDGLYGFLQYTDKPIGVSFRKWLRRDVLPEIRKTGAYITPVASPEHLRNKADELEKLSVVQESTKFILELIDNAGLGENTKLLAAKAIYRKAGIELPIEIKCESALYDAGAIAAKIGILSENSKPHANAVSAIIKMCNVPDSLKETVMESTGSWTGSTVKYKEEVLPIISNWLRENHYPDTIEHNNRKYRVLYQKGA